MSCNQLGLGLLDSIEPYSQIWLLYSTGAELYLRVSVFFPFETNVQFHFNVKLVSVLNYLLLPFFVALFESFAIPYYSLSPEM